jgi:hypothetical protein
MLPASGLPAGLYAGAWTGSELFLHQPYAADADGPTGSIQAAYNPSSSTWRRLPSSPYPVVPVEGGTRMIWTGTEMLAFGLLDVAYTPATNTWRTLPPGPGGPSVTVWTGQQVLMWGGGCCASNSAEGAAYDVLRNTWEPLPAAPLSGRHTSGAWTGEEMIIVGGQADEVAFADGAAYNPRTRSWRMLPPLPAPVANGTVTWTGSELLVVGGARLRSSGPVAIADTLAYNPRSDTWRRLSAMPVPRYEHMAVWTGNQLLVWGGQTTSTSGGVWSRSAPPNGVAYDPVTGAWSPMPKSPLRGRTGAVAVWTGTGLIVWGGIGVANSTIMTDGAEFRPSRVPIMITDFAEEAS